MVASKRVALIFKFFLLILFLVGCKNETLDGKLLYQKGEYQKALPLLEASCVDLDLQSCILSAKILAHQDGKIAQAKTLKAIQKACEYGDFPSCESLGHFFLNTGKTIQGIQIFRQGCQRGDPTLCFHLGEIFIQGKYLTPNQNQAYRFFEKSCYGGEIRGCKEAIHLIRNQPQAQDQIPLLEKQMLKNQEFPHSQK